MNEVTSQFVVISRFFFLCRDAEPQTLCDFLLYFRSILSNRVEAGHPNLFLSFTRYSLYAISSSAIEDYKTDPVLLRQRHLGDRFRGDNAFQ